MPLLKVMPDEPVHNHRITEW